MSTRRVALIDRPSGYVGPALARRLARAGHDLVLPGAGAEQCAALAALGAAVEAPDFPASGAGSLATAEGYARLVAIALDRFGRLDAASLMPGTRGAGLARGPLLTADPADLVAMCGYLETTLHALQATIPAMRARGGQIVVFTSDAGARPEAGWSLYGAVRAGQSFLVRAAALEHAREGVLINVIGSKNAIFPGFPGAPADAATDSHVKSGAWSAALEAETPLGRLGTMEELAAFAAGLLDGENRFQTAQYFSFSGGWNVV